MAVSYQTRRRYDTFSLQRWLYVDNPQFIALKRFIEVCGARAISNRRIISALAAHQQNLVNDARCSLLVGEPGKGDPLAHPRMTLTGKAVTLTDGPIRDAFRARYRQRNPKSKLYEDLPDFTYWRFHPAKISLNAGFGKAYALSPSDLDVNHTDGWSEMEKGVIEHMNTDHATAIDNYALTAGAEGTGWRLACVDPEGLDLVRADEVRRLWFDPPLQSVSELRQRLVMLARR